MKHSRDCVSAHIVLNAPLVPDGSIKIVEGVTNILGLAHNGDTTTLVAFGDPGETGELTLDIGGSTKKLELDYSATLPSERTEMAGAKTLRILSLSRQLADRTWIVGDKGHEYVVVGPEYVGDFAMKDGQPAMTIERPLRPTSLRNQVMVLRRSWHARASILPFLQTRRSTRSLRLR